MRGDPKVEKVAASLGLPNGRLIARSKGWYWETYPDHLVLFNASIANGAGRRLWWGDIDVTLDEEKLSALARALGVRLFVLFEGDAGFADEVPWEKAAFVVEPSGEVTLTDKAGARPDRRQQAESDTEKVGQQVGAGCRQCGGGEG